MGTVRRVSPLLGESSAIEELRDFIVGVSLRCDPVLLTGDAGTGKGLAAQKVHAVGCTSRAPFMRVSCQRFQTHEIEQLLFGREPGGRRSGILGSRSGSTCYLAGIEYLPPPISSLLGEYLVSGESRQPGRPRLLCSSRFDLQDLMNHGLHDSRFLDAISTYHMRIPPLRERPEDIPVLSSYQIWLRTPEDEYEGCWQAFEEDLLDDMLSYPWPGNVTELNGFVKAFCRNSGKRFRLSGGGPMEGASQARFLREELEDFYQELLDQLALESLSGRGDIVLPPDTRETWQDDS